MDDLGNLFPQNAQRKNLKLTMYKCSRVAIALACTCGLALGLLLVPPSHFRVAVALSLTGFPLMCLSHLRWSVTGFVCGGLILALPVWAAMTLLAWEVNLPGLVPWLPVLFNGCMVALAFFCMRHKPLFLTRVSHVDKIALLTGLVVLVPLLLVFFSNGPQRLDGKKFFFARLFIKEDTFYLFAIAQQALENLSYPDANPFIAGALNYYPSFLHCGLAGLSILNNGIVATALWPFLPLLIIPGVILGFLAVVKINCNKSKISVFLIAGVYLAFILMRIDHFAHPHLQAICFGLLALAMYHVPVVQNFKSWLLFTMLSLIIIMSHTVTSTVVFAITCSIALFSFMKRKWTSAAYGGASLVVQSALLLWFNYYEKAQVLASGVSDELFMKTILERVLPYVPMFAVALVMVLRTKLRTPLSLAALLLLGLTIVYWLTGVVTSSPSRFEFIMFNAPRFGWFGILLLCCTVNLKKNLHKAGGILLLFLAIVLPQPIVRDATGLIYEAPAKISYDQIETLTKAKDSIPLTSAILSNYLVYSHSVFTGRVSYLGWYLYALNTTDESPVMTRYSGATKFFNSMTPEERIDFMRTNNIGAVCYWGDMPEDFLPEVAVEVFRTAGLSVLVLKSV